MSKKPISGSYALIESLLNEGVDTIFGYPGGTILNVYTKPQFRKQGISTKVLSKLIDKAKRYNISKLELSATDMGKSLYEKIGFREKKSKYTSMQLYI